MKHGPSQSLSIAGHVYETDDVHAANAYISTHVTDHRLSVLNRESRIAFSCRRWSVGDLQVCDFSYGRAEVEIRLERAERHAFFLVLPLAGRATITRGGKRYELVPGASMLFSTDRDSETTFQDSKDFRNLNVRWSAASIHAFLAGELGRPLAEEIAFAHEPVPIDMGLRYLLEHAQSIASRLDDPQFFGLYAGRHLARHTHDLLLSLLVASFPSNYRDAYQAPNPQQLAPNYIRRAEDYMRAHARDPLAMADVACAVGVAARTLQVAFQRHRNHSALEFLRNERLALARESLSRARQRQLSVTDIALECGFVHLSRFASAYQRRYGEKPSDTLRKGA
jgi:AraC-like DNA-binding protein